MSSSEVPTAATIETIAPAAVTSAEAPAASVTPAAATDEAPVAPTVADTCVVDAPAAEPPAHDATEATAVAEEVKIDDDKKEKKHTRKPFADLLSKILKPHPQEKSTVEKKEATDASAPATEEVTPAPAPEAIIETTEAVIETPAEALAVEEAIKEASSPRKERGNIFEKLTALVMKPKSPKFKKSDAPKEDGDEIPVVEGTAEPQPNEDAAIVPPEAAPAVESAAVPAEAPAATETPEELKIEKKEKTPKDLAKLARRFSGRLFGVEKKKETKRPEPTPEETEGVTDLEAPAVAAVTSDAAPQIPADTPSVESSPEALQSTNDSAPVITAAA